MSRVPTASIVMPVYNADRYVAEAVESILAQTFGDYEFLIFDDGSTDDSLAVVRKYALQDGRIKVFAKPHAGMTRCLNEGITQARGEYIARMDADDVSLETRLAEQVELLNHNPCVVAVGSDLVIIGEDGTVLGMDRHETEHDTMVHLLLTGTLGVITHATAIMRRQALLAIGSYREQYDGLEDFDLLL